MNKRTIWLCKSECDFVSANCLMEVDNDRNSPWFCPFNEEITSVDWTKQADVLPEDPDPLPRKEVISIQPGDVITLKQDNPVEWISTCVTENCPINLTVQPGKFTLEVYREQVKDE